MTSNRIRHICFWLMTTMGLVAVTPPVSANPLLLRRSVYKIETTSQDRNFLNPWRLRSPENFSGTGFYIGDGRILTNAHVVSNASYITVQRDSDPKPMAAWVEFIGHDVDLAILKVKDKHYFRGVDTLAFGSIPRLRSPVSTVGFPLGGDQISITDGIVSRISYRNYVHSDANRHLLIQVDSAINPGNSGGPVFQGRNVVGVAFQSLTRAENTGYIIPTPVVQRFLADVADGKYNGVPEWGVDSADWFVNNPAAVRFYHLPKGEPRGVIVNKVYEWSPAAGILQQGDIILSIQGQEIGVDGRVVYEGERVDFEVLYDLLQIKDKVRLDILREGVVQEKSFAASTGKPHPYMGRIFSRRPRYTVFGGLVFTAFSRGVLELWGDDWYRKAPLMVRHLLQMPDLMPESEKREEIVAVTDVLTHRVNAFVDIASSIIVDKVNGKTVTGVQGLHDFLLSTKDKLLTIEFLNERDPWVLDMSELRGADAEINKQYGVNPSSWLQPLSVDGAIGKEDIQ